MEIQTEKGTAEGFPASDLQENNEQLRQIGIVLWGFLILALIIFIYVLFMTFYIIDHDVINNIVRECI